MGAEGTGIFQHDLSAEVRDTFFEYFDKGMNLNQIKQQIGDEFGYESLDGVEKEVYCGAMIHCLWEIGATNSEFIEQLMGLENLSSRSTNQRRIRSIAFQQATFQNDCGEQQSDEVFSREIYSLCPN